MPRLIVVILVVVLLFGGLYFLSTLASESPTKTIEVDVPQGGNAS
ncbi:MAG TPA: hypothetical protein VGB39_05775 [Sphingomicrobium sp.]